MNKIQKKSKVIGEGTYGCVHSPMLYCEDETKNVNMKDKISKILLKKNAQKEMQEYEKIDMADRGAKFYLGKPMRCTPKNNIYNEESIKKCKEIRPFFHDPLNSLYIDKYDLLIMRDGGVNLEDFTKKVLKKMKKSKESDVVVEKFLIQFYKIFPGIKNLLEHNLIHYDLKPSNFVYNQTKNELNFIDFGLMSYYDDVRKNCQDGGRQADFHWSYPIEIGYVNKDVFDRCKNNKKYVFEYMELRRLTRYYVTTIVGYISTREHHEFRNKFKNDLNYMFSHVLPEYEYEDLLDKCLSTIDTYGAGLTLMYIITQCKHLFDRELFNNLYEIAYNMIHPNLALRSDVNNCIDEYIRVLRTNGILERNNAEFDPETLEIKVLNNKDKNVENSKKMEKTIEKAFETPMNKEEMLENMQKQDQTREQKQQHPKENCPPDKEINPATNRCIKRCKEGEQRNDKFRCVKIKQTKKLEPIAKTSNPAKVNRKTSKNKQKKTKPVIECPPEKELNPATNRCVNRCKEGEQRNDKFRCIKNRGIKK